jgi:DNA-binding response OmpR family regulator/anti-sigma regulatory factor (Ser/Thr protein kinase)
MKKVLIIDDTPEVCQVIEETLGMFGFATFAAGDGEAGVAVAREQTPDLIICDINMPRMDGYATLRRIREHETTATIPFIFLSGVVDRPNMRRGMEMGADDYLTKPFTPSELLAAVNARLHKKAEIDRRSDQRLDELRGKMTLALPHELRTPLNGIMGLATILIEDHARLRPEEILESATYINDSAKRLSRLIENFLAYAQLELMAKDARKIVAQATATFTPVQALVLDTAREVARRFGRENDLQAEAAAGTVAGIPDNLQKIVEEITDNAFKFSEPGSPVRITGRLDTGHYWVEVTNEGRGMTAQQINAIAPHVQFEREKYEQQGAGLGLCIARRLCDLNGVRVDMASQPGRDMTVTLVFAAPASRQEHD